MDYYFVKCGCDCQCKAIIAAEFLYIVVRFNGPDEIVVLCWRCQNGKHANTGGER